MEREMTTEANKNKQVTLTKTQRESQVGADLLSLCQSVSSDGSLDDEEILQIREWLSEHKSTDLPAISFLIPIVESILEDGVVSDSERRELALAVERVLPSDIRGISKAARVAIESEGRSKQKAEREAAKAEMDAERAKAREEKERNRPVARFDFMVAGTRYEGRSKIIRDSVDEGDSVTLVRDPGNAHSRNAVEVVISGGEQIGFVPEEDAQDLAPLLDSGHKYTAHVKRLLTEGRSPIPVVFASVYRADADLSSKKGAAASSRQPVGSGLLRIFVALVVVGLLVKACS
jgi:hypothetical protein